MANQEYNMEVLKKAGGIILSVTVVLLFVYFVGLLDKSEPLPEEFVKEYREIVVGSKEVAEISNSVADKIEEVDDLEASGKTSTALQLIEEARALNEKARNKASKLLFQLENLTEMTLRIESHKQKKELAEAVQTELALVSEFVGYTSNVDEFLDSLSIAVVSDEKVDKSVVRRNLQLVNEKRQTINDLSDRFLAKASQLGIFD